MELNRNIRKKKDLSGLTVLKSFFCVCEKWSVIFVISKFFLLADVLKRSAIADKHPLFAALLTPPMLITAFLHFWHKGHWEPCNDVGPLSPAKLLMGFELGMF